MTDDVDMSAAGRALPPGMLDTFMSVASTTANQSSSFAWDKVVDTSARDQLYKNRSSRNTDSQ